MPPSRSSLFLILMLTAVSIVNLFHLKPEIDRIKGLKKFVPHQIIGYQFEGLGQELKGVSHVGYYTDQDLAKNDDAAKLFSYAQYVLAPSILDLNNTGHYYTLFVCEQESVALRKIKELNLETYRGNEYGMILARKRR